jgi:hypothetical protein
MCWSVIKKRMFGLSAAAARVEKIHGRRRKGRSFM